MNKPSNMNKAKLIEFSNEANKKHSNLNHEIYNAIVAFVKENGKGKKKKIVLNSDQSEADVAFVAVDAEDDYRYFSELYMVGDCVVTFVKDLEGESDKYEGDLSEASTEQLLSILNVLV